MTANDIRSKFLTFFRAREHRVVPSSSLVPANDPTLLFSNAGMNQFKDVFLGREKRDYTRACSSQKCVRAGGKHNDLEQVGRTTRHHTFFEMLGNFSFGDYFKKEAIPWAWELITVDFGIPKDKLYVTIFEGAKEQDIPRDAEAYDGWREIVPANRIFELGMKDNFWQMGETGPCGPCSEIHYDLGPAASEQGHTDCRFPCDCGRYVELWNLVFMQYNRDEQGTLTPLPRPSIDTGAGLERLATVLQGKLSNFETDLFRPLIDEAAALANVEYGANHESDVSLRIIADHARAATFLISDGVLPSNEGRGYVLRLIMRRALYHGQTLGLNEPFLYKLSGTVVEMMKYAYPALIVTAQQVTKAIKTEEEQYARTTRYGLEQLDRVRFGKNLTFGEWKAHWKLVDGQPNIVERQKDGWTAVSRLYGTGKSPGEKIPGVDVFKLHDTYGLRPEFVEDIVKNYGLTIDRAGYEAEMQKQRERARASWKGAEKKVALPVYQQLVEKHKTVFTGYTETFSPDCGIVALVVKGEPVDEVKPGNEVEIVLDHTPFYAEAGGQVGDVGHFFGPGSTTEVAHVAGAYYPVSGIIAHQAVARETLRVGDVVTAVVDTQRRDAIRRNHTATHLLHAALRHTLGTHVKQAGSLVAPDRLRFDFSHYASLDPQDLLDIEDLVNEHVLRNEEVVTSVMELDAAVNAGAMALFGEKYGDKVRVVSIADGSFSKELCGGTHVRRTGDIGLFKVVSEGSVAAGTRRIEALTGMGVLEDLRRTHETLRQLEQTLRSKPEKLAEAAEKLAESEKKLRKQLEAQQMKRAAASAGDLVDRAQDVKGVRVLSARVESMDRAAMRQMVDNLRARLGSGVIVLGSASDGKVSLIAAVTQDLTNRLDAGKIVKAAAAIVEGSGGGRKDLAEAGGKNPEKLDESLQAVPGIVEGML
ncbi:MAG TPA: alanine--tRNA ligase [Terriglobia bacterium]|nr:alanine--tRNA ligase [Terriglobia bacterium]